MSETPGQRVSTATDRRSCPNLDPTFAALDAHGIRWSKFSPQREEETGSRLARSIFRKIMSGGASFVRIRHTTRGGVASFYMYINFSGESRTWTCAYRTVSSYLKCPLITSGPSIDAATAAITENGTPAYMVRNQVTLHRSPLRDLIPRSNPTRVQRSSSS
jgi:hypothetical protein